MAKRARPPTRRKEPSWKFEIAGEGRAPTTAQINQLKQIFRLTALATLRVRKAGALDRMFVTMKKARR